MARTPLLLVIGLLTTALVLSGCLEPVKTYTRAGDEAGDFFTFKIAEGTRSVVIEFSTEEGTGEGSVRLYVRMIGSGNDTAPLYTGSLPAGERVKETVKDPDPGDYAGVLSFEDYDGPARVDISAAAGGIDIGPFAGFWDMLGIVITLGVAGGGVFLYRRHTKRLDREMARIDETFDRLHDDVAQCRVELKNMQEALRRRLVQNKLRESHFLILEQRIGRYLEDLRRDGGFREDEAPLALE